MPLTALDRLEILELAARYNHAVDHRRAEEWADVFTEDGVLYAGDQVRAQGRAGFIALVERRIEEGRQVRHWISNAVIDGDGAQARLRLYFKAYDITDALEAPYAMGEYDDELVKVNGRWKFKVRRILFTAGRSVDPR